MASRRLRTLVSLVTFGLVVTILPGCTSLDGAPLLREADEYTQAKDFDRAITAYQQHIEERRADAQRPEWENPAFYLLSIGDLELARGNFEKALERYEEAEREGVEVPLVADRYRAVASTYEEKGNLHEALTVLTRYRDRDPLIFDSMLDRIARRLTEEEGTIASAPLSKTEGHPQKQSTPTAAPR